MSSYDFELWIEQYKAIIKEKGERPLFDKEINFLKDHLKDIPEEYTDAFKKASNGVFDEFEKLPHLL